MGFLMHSIYNNSFIIATGNIYFYFYLLMISIVNFFNLFKVTNFFNSLKVNIKIY